MPVASQNKCLSLAVHLHIYYVDMWEEIKEYLKNIGDYPYDLFVTMVEDNQELRDKITTFHKAAKIWVVENRGYDIGPFIDFLHHIDLDKYDLILKLHTKNKTAARGNGLSYHGLSLTRCQWRDILYQGLLGTPQNFTHNLNCFQKEHIGMVGAPVLIEPKNKKSAEDSYKTVQRLLTEMGLPEYKNPPFVAGTMFICRASLLQPLKKRLTLQDFPLSDQTFQKETFAHAVERLFGAIIVAQGYKLASAKVDNRIMLKALINTISHFLYQEKVTKHNHKLKKICKLPVYKKELNSQ